MKINLTLESGLEVEFIPDFKLPNHSEQEKVKWILSKKKKNSQKESLINTTILFEESNI